MFDELRFAAGLLDSSVGVVLVDFDADRRLGQVSLHVRLARRSLRRYSLLLRLLLHLEGLDLLVGDFALGQHAHEFLRKDDILNVDPFGFDFIFRQLLEDVLHRLLLDRLAALDEFHRFHATQLVAEQIAYRSLKDFVDQVQHAADHGNDAWRLGVRHVDQNLKVDGEDEAFAALRHDGFESRIQAVGAGNAL